jgi:hypothetical protein
MAKLQVDLIVEDKGKAVISGFGKDLDKVMSEGKTQVESLGKALAVGGAAVAAFAAAGLVIAGREMGKAVDLANAQVEAETKLAAVLTATGESAGYNAQELKTMAAEMQSVTTVGDEVIIGGMAILATFKEVSGDGFERATMAAMDMSTIMGTDLKSAITQVGKALNDPIKGMSALSDAGVTFTNQQREQITALQESGDMLGAQNIILAELESQFGGAATAMRDTYGGAITALGNSWGDLYETVGMSIVQNETFVELAKIAEEVVSGWTKALGENGENTKSLASTIAVNLVSAVGAAIQGVGYLHTAWVSIPAAVPVVVDAFQWAGDQVFQILRSMLTPLDALFASMEKVANFVGKEFTNPFDILQAKIDDFGAMTQAVMESNFEDIARVRDQYNGYGQAIDGMVERIVNAGTQEKAVREDVAVAAETSFLAIDRVSATTVEAASQRIVAAGTQEKAVREDVAIHAKEKIAEVDEAARAAAKVETERLAQQAAAHMEHAGTITDSWLTSVELRDKAESDLEEAENQRATDRMVLESAVTDEINRLTLSEKDYAIAALEAEYAVAMDMAEGDKDLAQMVADWKLLKLQEIEDANLETTQDMATAWEDFSTSAINTFTDVFGDVLKGGYKDIGDAWDDLMSGIGDKFVDTTVNMAADWGASQVSKLFEGWELFHDGLWNLKDDEMPAILQRGEMVIPAGHAEEIRNNFNGISDGDFGGLVEATQHADVGNWGSSGTFGGNLGAEYGRDLQSAAIGVATGQMSPTEAMAGLVDPTSGLENVSTAMATSGISALGLGGVYSDVGQFVGKAVATATLGGVPGPVGILGRSLGAFVGAYVGDLVGDLLNDREFEGLLDAMEDGRMSDTEAQRFKSEAMHTGMDVTGGSKLGEMVAAVKGWIDDVKAALSFDLSGGDLNDYGGDLSDYGGDMGRGGWGDDGDMSVDNEGIAHTGGYLMRADEGRIIAQTGEGVLSRVGMRNLDRLNTGDFGGESADEVRGLLIAIASNTRQTAKILQRFEYTGIPQSTRQAVA